MPTLFQCVFERSGRGSAILVQPLSVLVFNFGFIDFPLGSSQRPAEHLFDRTGAHKAAGGGWPQHL
jgi:hypothetical protein